VIFTLIAKWPVARWYLLVIGGALGPVAALFSVCGMGIFYLTLKAGGRKLAFTAATLLAVMMLIGSSYHAVFTVFGFASKVGDQRRAKLSWRRSPACETHIVSHVRERPGRNGLGVICSGFGRKRGFPAGYFCFFRRPFRWPATYFAACS